MKNASAIAALSFAVAGSSLSADTLKVGPFLPQPAATVYIVADGQPVTAKLSVKAGKSKEGERLLVRVFDPEENLSLWKYSEPGQARLNTPGDREVEEIPALQMPLAVKPGESILDLEIPLKGKGVNQLRVVAGAANSSSELALSRPLPYGVSFQNGDFSSWPGQPKTMYIYVPPHAEELNISGGPLLVRDESGAVVIDSSKAKPGEPLKAQVAKTGVVWTFEFQDLSKLKFRAWGFPVILCPSKDAAMEIKASVEVLPDGTTVCHKFQRRIAELLPKMLAPENVGKAETLIVPLASRKEEWLKDAEKNSFLLNPYCAYSAVEKALRNQDLEPGSHWGGAMGGFQNGKPADDWRTLEKLAPPENRWDRYIGPKGMASAGGVSPRTMDAQGLAEAANIDAPFNPYYGKKELLYRAAAASLKDLMALGEDEVWPGESSSDPYPGFPGFVLGQKTLPTYALVAPQMPPEIKALWTEGVRRLVDRVYPDGLVSCRNQSSHFLVIFEDFAKGSGDPCYAELAKAYSDRFIKGLSPAGFAVESMGPDLTYNGMTHWHMGLYAKESGDKDMLAAIKKSYDFFNHTVAPEPNGKTMLGASNMGHRTANSFVHEQWGGARGILDDAIPEVAIWNRTLHPESKEERDAEAAKYLPKALSAELNTASPETCLPRYQYYSERIGGYQWPALSEEPFTKNLSNEMIAIKRPGYYAVVYVGHPAPHEHYIKGREKFRHPLPDDAEDKGGTINSRKIAAFLGGGLSMFWTKPFGSALLAMNWAPTTHQGIIATKEDGTRWWEDYFATKFNLKQDNSELVITGRIEGLPIFYTRVYRLLDDRLEVSLELKAEKAVSLQRLVENFPIPVGEEKTDGMEIKVQGEKDNLANASEIQLLDKKGKGVSIVFEKAQDVSIQRNGPLIDKLQQIGRVETLLPIKLEEGQTVLLKYSLKPN